MVAKGLNPPAVRTGSGPCNFCGDDGLKDPKTGKPLRMNNYTYPENLIPGTRAYEDLAGAEAGSVGGGGGGIRPATRE